MNLKSRIEKVERQGAPFLVPVIQTEAENYRQYIWSLDFLNDVFKKACELLQTMTKEHRAIVLADFVKVAKWHQDRSDAIEQGVKKEWSDKWQNYYPDSHILSQLFAVMIKGSIEGFYFGALAIPANVAQGWIDDALRKCTCPYPEKGRCAWRVHINTHMTCEDCGYYAPGSQPKWNRPPCAMCGGLVSYWGYELSHGMSAAKPLDRRDANHQTILTESHIMHFLGLLCKHGDLRQ